jgi:Lysyl oxidase
MPSALRLGGRRGFVAAAGLSGLAVGVALLSGAATGAPGATSARPAPATRNAALLVQDAAHAQQTALAAAAARATTVTGAVALVAATPTVHLEHNPGEPVWDGDLGFYLVTGAHPVVVSVHRPVYSKPATATLSLGGKARALPAGLADLNGLHGFLTVKITNAKGAVVSEQTMDYCPGDGGGAARARPDAPDSSPYPSPGCSYHPFAQGALVGLQAGWLTSLQGFTGADLADGTYRVTTRLGNRWRALLTVPTAQASATVALTISTTPGPTPSPSDTPTESPTDTGTPTPSPSGPTKTCGSPDSVNAVAAARRAESRHADLVAKLASVAGGVLRSTGGIAPAAAAAAGTAGTAKAPRPDLQPLPSFGIQLMLGKDLDERADAATAGHCFLAFSATVWNAGPSPLVVEGFRRPGAALMDAYQYFYAGTRQVSYAKVGTMEYDPRVGHQHWHFKDFAQYNLLDSRQRQKVRSQKEAFCLAPTDAVDLTRPGAQWNPASTGLFSACGGQAAMGIRENLEAGWGDTYQQFRPGQAFDVDALPNGRYYIEIVANPDRRLQETSTANNRSLRKIVLGGTAEHRTVTVPPYQGIDAP